MPENNFLEIRGLRIHYKTEDETVYAVNGANLNLGRRETLGLVGETGAGKTTTALSILRLLPKNIGFVTDGSIALSGEDLLSIPEKQMLTYRGKRVSMIFQDPMTSLNPVIPIGKQIAEVLKLHNTTRMTRKEIDDRVDEMLEMVDIPAFRKKEYPHQFSGGMKQRVVIAISLACEPELLIADEPTTALDVTIQAQVLSLMSELQEKIGTSMLLITHDLGVVSETCDKVAVMYAGEIVESGPIEDVFGDERRHPYTEGLFGSLPDLEVGKRRLSPIYGLMPNPTKLPSGCKFHPRCPHRMEICSAKQPEELLIGEHMLKCHLFGQGG